MAEDTDAMKEMSKIDAELKRLYSNIRKNDFDDIKKAMVGEDTMPSKGPAKTGGLKGKLPNIPDETEGPNADDLNAAGLGEVEKSDDGIEFDDKPKGASAPKADAAPKKEESPADKKMVHVGKKKGWDVASTDIPSDLKEDEPDATMPYDSAHLKDHKKDLAAAHKRDEKNPYRHEKGGKKPEGEKSYPFKNRSELGDGRFIE